MKQSISGLAWIAMDSGHVFRLPVDWRITSPVVARPVLLGGVRAQTVAPFTESTPQLQCGQLAVAATAPQRISLVPAPAPEQRCAAKATRTRRRGDALPEVLPCR